MDEPIGRREEAHARPAEGALRASTIALGAVVVAAPLVMGGARPDHQLVLAFLGLLAFCVTAFVRVGFKMRFRWPLLAPALLALLALVQLVPLPASLIETLSPRTHELFLFTLGDLGLYGAAAGHALSVDPPSTGLAFMNQLAFLAVAWAASEVPRGHRRGIEQALIFGAALVAIIGFVHLAFGQTRIYGFYAPVNGAPMQGYFSTFVNNNTLASFLSLGTLLALGHAADADEGQVQRRHFTAAALCAVGVFLSASRGGQLALLAGLVAFAALAHYPGNDASDTRRDRSRNIARVGLVLSGVGLGLALLLLPDWSTAMAGGLVTENKFAAWPAAVDYALAFPAFGTGRGTFSVAYPLFQSLTMPSLVSHPENIVLQHLCEWGVVGAIVGLGGGIAGFVFAVRAPGRTTLPRHWGLLAALVAVSVGQLADFGLESAGLAFPTAACLGLVLSRLPRRRRGAIGRRLPVMASAGAVLALAYMTWQGPVALSRLPNAAVTEMSQVEGDAAAIETAARDLVVAHPADAYFALKVAQRLIATAAKDFSRTMRWLNRALYLAPNAGETRLIAARALAQRGLLPQAADEYRAAMEALPWEAPRLIHEIAGRFETAEMMIRATSPSPEHRRSLGNLALARRPAPFASEFVRLLQEEAPDDPDLWALRARASLALPDLEDAERAAARIDALNRPLVAAIIRARVAFRRGDRTAARTGLDAVRVLGVRDRDFLRAAAELFRDLGELASARDCLDKLWPLVALEPRNAVAAVAQRADLELKLGEPLLALHGFERAWRMQPKPAYARGLTAAAERLGRPESARAILESSPPSTPGNPEAPGLEN